jgi:hypothetical protein
MKRPAPVTAAASDPGGAGQRVTAAHGAEPQQEESREGERTRGDTGGGLEIRNESEEGGARGERKVVSGEGGGGGDCAGGGFEHGFVPLAADVSLQSEGRATPESP